MNFFNANIVIIKKKFRDFEKMLITNDNADLKIRIIQGKRNSMPSSVLKFLVYKTIFESKLIFEMPEIHDKTIFGEDYSTFSRRRFTKIINQ